MSRWIAHVISCQQAITSQNKTKPAGAVSMTLQARNRHVINAKVRGLLFSPIVTDAYSAATREIRPDLLLMSQTNLHFKNLFSSCTFDVNKSES